MLKYLQSVEMANAKICQLPGPDIETNMQISDGKPVEALTLPKPQGHLCPSKGTSFMLASRSLMVLTAGKNSVFCFVRLNKRVGSVRDRMHTKMCISDILWEIDLVP